MVYVFIPNSTANSLAVLGSINPELLTPSVSRIIILLLAWLSFNRFTEVAKPIPMAVPPSIVVMYFISFEARSTKALSLVIGVFVSLSPAYSTSPILSLGLSFINCAATTFKASSLFGFKSFANILAETSIAITMSIPRVVFVLVDTSTVRGLAKAVIIKARTNKRITKRACFNFGKIELLVLKPFKLDIFSSAVCLLNLNIYQSRAIGSNKNNQKYSLFTNSIPSNIIDLFF